VLDRLATHLRLSPKQKPGLFRQLREDKSRQIAAVAFAFHHDDGQNAAELDRAEVVLVGVSRTMKTPTTLYLAYRGWFAANVPLVPELPLPPGLLAVAPQRVFCLLTSPEQLQQMRRVRAKEEAIPMQGYASAAQVRHELAYSEELCRQHGWQPIDCAGKSVEEVAQEIILLLSES
jgi:regulator of PEP synthase PpsR (kinase-PPPase family)